MIQPLKLRSKADQNVQTPEIIFVQCSYNISTVKPRFTAEFGGKETSAINRGPR